MKTLSLINLNKNNTISVLRREIKTDQKEGKKETKK